MKYRAMRLLHAGLAAVLAASGLETGIAAEGQAAQELVSVSASTEVTTALWTRSADTYTLQVVIDLSRQQARNDAIIAANRARQAANPEPPVDPGQQGVPVNRSTYFIGNTIANLRGLDPAFHCGRTLTLVDGRRTLRPSPPPSSSSSPSPPPPPSPASLPPSPYRPSYAPLGKERRVEVWLLRADGTQILPAGYSCTNNRASIDVQYRFPVDVSADAVAAAVRIDSDFHIEKLQPLVLTPAADDQAR